LAVSNPKHPTLFGLSNPKHPTLFDLSNPKHHTLLSLRNPKHPIFLSLSNPKNPGLLNEILAFAPTGASQPQAGGPGTVSRHSFTLRLVCSGDHPHTAISLRESRAG
jgi:hypothetical protein